ncbi:unnamed protein product [Eruca vesicaria subsp. sativa]|uniref:Uncharacterized protein n=1 Tax=Eruca vesicaria subsp. sativa TaxID=29727 RepID=A0ABC8ITK0_ERUVS|nr:unnamed protein product [Eruca vesicaria subsp. sativa]
MCQSSAQLTTNSWSRRTSSISMSQALWRKALSCLGSFSTLVSLGEIVVRGFTITGYYPPLSLATILEETKKPSPLTDASIER